MGDTTKEQCHNVTVNSEYVYDDNDFDPFTDNNNNEETQSNSQEEISDSQFNDEDMYHLMQSNFGQLDRKTFKDELIKHTTTQDMRPIRNSLFDLLRKRELTLKDAKLVERAQRDNIGEKLADDIYIIFQFLEGANNISELKQCISKSPRRMTTGGDDSDSKITDICVKLTNRTKTKQTDNAVIIALILELKQSFDEHVKNTEGKIDKMVTKYDEEIKNLRNKIDVKDIELINQKSQLAELRDKNTKLQSELKLKSQQLRESEDENRQNEEQKETNLKIFNRLEAIDGKCKQMSMVSKKQFSDVVKDSKLSKSNTEFITRENDTDQFGNEAQIESVSMVNHEQRHYPTYTDNDSEFTNDRFNQTLKPNHVLSNLVVLSGNDQIPKGNKGQPIEPLVSDGDTSVFRGVVRKRTKRIVLYNVRADKPYELVNGAVKSFAEKKGVKITFSKLLKKREGRGYSTYIMRVNIVESDFEIVELNENFWPAGVYWREYVPYNSNFNNNNQTEQSWN
ncbi:unnamed protein product [Mytilus edulis]|uniref:Uncharacterized protein n=1 Tax=Mytilus edulis TaxID=6550 RepID=A0A8S3PPW7_MYTED|nr:unnamed protein product [Mytilus edulis]